MKISGVYKITNTVTNDCYIGSSKDIKSRWAVHKCPSRWKDCPNNPMYQDMQKYGVDKFDFQILAEVEPKQLKESEQEFIEKLQPTYNNNKAKGRDTKKIKAWRKKYRESEKYKEYQKEYQQSKKCKEAKRKRNRKYNNKHCSYNGETLTINALYKRFQRAGIEHPNIEAKKYLLDR